MNSKPMISSEIGTGTTYINIHGETGLVVPPTDVDSLAAAMSQLWNDEDKARQMGENAYQRYLALFTADKMASQYAELYRNLIKENS
jgi:rhamnosyl/mannosyltransferase